MRVRKAQRQKPDWLKVRFRITPEMAQVRAILEKHGLHTVCEEATCPNIMECFGRKTATFMILGANCTRNCTFCDVKQDHPQPVDPNEPTSVAQAVLEMGLRHVVVTSVTRDDLEDGGASQFAQVIREIRNVSCAVTIEVLIPDFCGDNQALAQVTAARPHIVNHNVETVPRLYPNVRPQAVYERSLRVLETARTLQPNLITKSGIMVGLGEHSHEVEQVMQDLRQVDCDLLTIGQYLAPSARHHPVVAYVTPETFAYYQDVGEQLGFKHVASSPLVRSSYHAEQAIENM